MKASQFRDLTEEELQQKLADLKDDLFRLRIRHSVAKLENPMRLKEVKRDIARVQTVVRELQLKKEKGASGVANAVEAPK
jgi:large subunit ribosomal protein L29